MKMKAKK